MREIQLTQGKVALVSDHQYEELSKYKWCAVFNGYLWYAFRQDGRRPNRRGVYMHKQIMNTPPGMETDHIDGNTLNNQEENLRVCTHAENNRNKGKQSNNTSGYKGVQWSSRGKKWQARIKINGKTISLRMFANKEDAARRYDTAVFEYHGEFAKPNSQEGIPS